ncbi:MAG: 16S rRNA (guanine(527)-N(7))-methyltransferase RsmG [Desulfobacterales bacterium]|nr:16S rRNA (guanine(527)-N(7))-methyltransferase RsmG [Desulfobacterales bacterium]
MESLFSKQVPDITAILVKGAEQISITLTSQVVENYLFYIEELKKWNKSINLTSLATDRDIAVKHFLDSLTVAPFLQDARRVLDIGTGAGFPGLPLKILSPSIELLLLESSQKKCSFLHHIVRGLKLAGVEIVHGRAEDRTMIERYAGGFDLVLSRALADLPTSLQLALPYTKRGGRIVGMRGRQGEQERDETDWNALGLQLIEMRKLTLPFVQEQRVLLLFQRAEK